MIQLQCIASSVVFAYVERSTRTPKGERSIKKVVNIITTILMVAVLLVAFALVGVKIFGLSPYTVLSGSMEPTYHVGSLIYIEDVNTADLKVGDPITYVIEGGTVVTHRIIEIIPDYGENGELGFKTKGDANQTEDGTPVHENNVLGKPVFSIPLLGYVAFYIQNPPGSYLAIGACLVIALLTFLPGLVDKLLDEDTAGTTPTQQTEGEGTPPEDAQHTVEYAPQGFSNKKQKIIKFFKGGI